YREENIPLYTDLAKLSNEYQKITGSQTVEWEGETKTLSQLSPILQEPDRARREKAWRAIAGRRLQDRDALDALYDRMLALRKRIAANAGLDFVDYTFRGNLRDYAP